MIQAIIPIPQRYPIGYTLGSGFRISGRMGISGRTIKVLPLYFYKIFSTHGNASYQHIFASDSIINPITLESSRNNFNLQKDYYGGVLVPISVKRFDATRPNTFLFPRCINFLLQNYRQNIPIDEVDVLNDGAYSELSPGCPGVVGISEFNFYYLKNFMETHQWCGMNSPQRLLMSAISPEAPYRISNYVQEIENCHLHGDALAQYISDLCTYETGTALNMREFLEMEKYDFPMDPITQLCACTPSYLYGHQLRPFLGNEMNLSGYSRIGYNPVDNELTRSPLNFMFEQADPYAWSDEVMEDLINMADEDFRLTITPNGPVMESFSTLSNQSPSIITHLYDSLMYSFPQYKQIEIVKNWADEVFMTVWSGSNNTWSPPGPHTFYLNLAWYHLTSPSLINMNLVR